MTEHHPAENRARLRRLTDEEIALWLSVAKTVAPRRDSVLPQPAAKPPAPPAAPSSAAEARRAASPASSIPVKAAQKPPAPPLAAIERKLRQKLSRGRLAPDAAIDLHGLRAHEASVALRQFLLRAQHEGMTIVLVVTGKGRGAGSAEEEAGVLRRNVPHWLRGPDYHALVVGFEEASRPHGGAGALYVRMRRRRRVDPPGR